MRGVRIYRGLTVLVWGVFAEVIRGVGLDLGFGLVFSFVICIFLKGFRD